MSIYSADKIKWLRDHGIEVETPEDRIAKKKAAEKAQSLKINDPGTRTFKFVLCLMILYCIE